MSTTIGNVYIDEFNQYLRHLAQQKYSRLRPYVYEVASGAQTYSFDRVDATRTSGVPDAADPKTTRGQTTPVENYPFTRRVVTAATYNVGELIEFEDQIQAKVDISGGLVQAMAMQMARRYDDVIITAFGGDATDGDGMTQTFPAAQRIGDGTADINFDLITQVQQRFLQNDIQGEVEKVFVIGPAQVRRLLQLTEQTSSDYSAVENRRALMNLNGGLIVPNWMGFTWICSTRLLSPSSGQRDCYAFTYRAIGLAVNRDITTFVQQDPSRSFAWSLYSQMTIAATRVEDEQIVGLRVAETT